jgi:hypothetical protein
MKLSEMQLLQPWVQKRPQKNHRKESIETPIAQLVDGNVQFHWLPGASKVSSSTSTCQQQLPLRKLSMASCLTTDHKLSQAHQDDIGGQW